DAVALREVAHHLRVAEELAGVVAHRRDDDVRPERRAVAPHAPFLLLEAAFLRRDLQLARRLAAVALARRVELREMPPGDLVGGVAEQALRARIPARHASL